MTKLKLLIFIEILVLLIGVLIHIINNYLGLPFAAESYWILPLVVLFVFLFTVYIAVPILKKYEL